MKIAILSSLYPPYNVGGTEKAVATLAESLSAQGLEVVVLSLHPGRKEIVEEINGVRVYRLPVDNTYVPWLGGERPGALRRLWWHVRDRWNRRAAKRVEAILRREQPDVLHSHSLSGFSVAVWAAAKRLEIPRVHTLHDYYALCSRTTLYKDKRVCTSRCLDCVALTWGRKPATELVDAIVGVSESILERHLQAGYFSTARQQMIHNIQLPLAQVAEVKRPVLTFGFIGRVTEEKGVELLLEAMQELRGEDCRLKIAGDGATDYIGQLQQRFPDERVEWLGYIPTESFYERVDVVVVPSVWEEPLGYACIESLFAGRNVIAADTGGLREIARLAPLHRLFRSNDRLALAEALQAAMRDAALWRTPHRPSEEALSAFSEATVSGRYKKIYASVLAQDKHRTE